MLTPCVPRYVVPPPSVVGRSSHAATSSTDATRTMRPMRTARAMAGLSCEGAGRPGRTAPPGGSGLVGHRQTDGLHVDEERVRGTAGVGGARAAGEVLATGVVGAEGAGVRADLGVGGVLQGQLRLLVRGVERSRVRRVDREDDV